MLQCITIIFVLYLVYQIYDGYKRIDEGVETKRGVIQTRRCRVDFNCKYIRKVIKWVKQY
jgi:hypothetical protein